MKKSIREARKDFRNTQDINDKISVKKCKKEFRRAQRRNIFIYEDKKKILKAYLVLKIKRVFGKQLTHLNSDIEIMKMRDLKKNKMRKIKNILITLTIYSIRSLSHRNLITNKRKLFVN